MRAYATPDGAPLRAARPSTVRTLPDPLKARLETAHGFDLSRVRVHRDSPHPARLGADAFTFGPEIHLGPGSERHLPHEAWHVVQQLQGRVAPGLDTSPTLEAEADRMGASAFGATPAEIFPNSAEGAAAPALQRKVRVGGGTTKVNERDYLPGGTKAAVGTKRKVKDLIGDGVKRVIPSATS